MLIVLGIKLFRFIKGQDRFGVLRCALNSCSRNYEGQCDENRPHGFGRIYLLINLKSSRAFSVWQNDGFCRLVYDKKLEYKSFFGFLGAYTSSLFSPDSYTSDI